MWQYYISWGLIWDLNRGILIITIFTSLIFTFLALESNKYNIKLKKIKIKIREYWTDPIQHDDVSFQTGTPLYVRSQGQCSWKIPFSLFHSLTPSEITSEIKIKNGSFCKVNRCNTVCILRRNRVGSAVDRRPDLPPRQFLPTVPRRSKDMVHRWIRRLFIHREATFLRRHHVAPAPLSVATRPRQHLRNSYI